MKTGSLSLVKVTTSRRLTSVVRAKRTRGSRSYGLPTRPARALPPRECVRSRTVAVSGVQLRGIDGRNTSRAQRRRRAAPQPIGHLDLYRAEVPRAVDRLGQRRAHGSQPRGLLVEVPGCDQMETGGLGLPCGPHAAVALLWGRRRKPPGRSREGRQCPSLRAPRTSRGGQACRCPGALDGECNHAEAREALAGRRAPGVVKAGHQPLLRTARSRVRRGGRAAGASVRDERLGSTHSGRPAAGSRPFHPRRR